MIICDNWLGRSILITRTTSSDSINRIPLNSPEDASSAGLTSRLQLKQYPVFQFNCKFSKDKSSESKLLKKFLIARGLLDVVALLELDVI